MDMRVLQKRQSRRKTPRHWLPGPFLTSWSRPERSVEVICHRGPSALSKRMRLETSKRLEWLIPKEQGFFQVDLRNFFFVIMTSWRVRTAKNPWKDSNPEFGGWTAENARPRLNRFCMMERISCDFQNYSEGPCHKKVKITFSANFRRF